MTNFRSTLVTGGTGFIGSALVRRLLADGIRVYCLLRARPRPSAALNALAGTDIILTPSFSIEDLETSLRGLSVDVLYNLASYGVNPDDRDPEALVDGNVSLLARLLIVGAQLTPKRFVHTGSCSEYGSPPNGNAYLSEAQPLRPISLYGAAKAAAGVYGNALAARRGIPFVTLRLFGVFGIGERPHRLIPHLIRNLQLNRPVDLTGGDQVRDMLYVDDVTEALVIAGRDDGLVSFEAYNVCSGRPIRIREIGEAVADAMAKPRDLLRWGARPYRQDEPMWLVGDNRRFTEATRWRPQISLADGIRRMTAATGEVPAGLGRSNGV